MIAAMNPPEVFDALESIGAQWSGRGVAVECGTWLGASLAALAKGLVRAGYDRELHSFDKWSPKADEVEKAKSAGVTIHVGEDISHLARANVAPIYPNLQLHRGKLKHARWTGESIEVFILDAAKRMPDFGIVMDAFAPSFISGVTIIGLLDFDFWRKARESNHPKWEEFRIQAQWAAVNGHLLEPMDGFRCGSAEFFRVLAPLPKIGGGR